MLRKIIAAVAAFASLVAGALPAAADDEGKDLRVSAGKDLRADRMPHVRVWEPPLQCAYPHAAAQVLRQHDEDTPATLYLLKAGVGAVDTQPLDVYGEVIVLRDPDPIGEGASYAVRVVTAGHRDVVAKFFTNGC